MGVESREEIRCSLLTDRVHRPQPSQTVSQSVQLRQDERQQVLPHQTDHPVPSSQAEERLNVHHVFLGSTVAQLILFLTVLSITMSIILTISNVLITPSLSAPSENSSTSRLSAFLQTTTRHQEKKV